MWSGLWGEGSARRQGGDGVQKIRGVEESGSQKRTGVKEMRELGSRVRSQGFRDRGQISYDVT